jgi:hypothetical protein
LVFPHFTENEMHSRTSRCRMHFLRSPAAIASCRA